MDLYTINKIKTTPILYNYLRVDSSWYKYLNRDINCLKIVENKAKEYYGLTLKAKIKKINNKVELVSNILDVLK